MSTLDLSAVTDNISFSYFGNSNGLFVINRIPPVVTNYFDVSAIVSGSGEDTFNWRASTIEQSLDGGPAGNKFSLEVDPNQWTIDLASGKATSPDSADITLANFQWIVGNGSINDIRGDGNLNVIDAGGGSDLVEGRGGLDIMDGGEGIDTLSYQSSPAGVKIGLNPNSATGGDAEGDVFSGFENITGSLHNDILNGDSGPNILFGLAGNDILAGFGGLDQLWGGAGDDIISVGGGLGTDDVVPGEIYDGGAGNDKFEFPRRTEFLDFRTSIISSVETIKFRDALTGSGSKVTLSAAQIMNSIEQIDDTSIAGETVIIRVYMESRDDLDLSALVLLGFTDAKDTIEIYGDEAFEIIAGSAARDRVDGGSGNDVLQGLSNADILIGGDGDDTLDGGTNPEIGDLGAQGDVMVGGDGNDTYLIDSPLDLADEDFLFPGFGHGGIDTILTRSDFYWDTQSVGETVLVEETVNDIGGDGVTVVGGIFANTLVGHSGTDILFGRGGTDTYRGGDGVDWYSLSTLGLTDANAYAGVDGVNTVIVEKRVTGALSYDIVFEFESGKDRLDVSDYGFASQAEAFATGVNDGAGSSYFVLGDGLDYLYVVGKTLEQLSPDDFTV